MRSDGGGGGERKRGGGGEEREREERRESEERERDERERLEGFYGGFVGLGTKRRLCSALVRSERSPDRKSNV